MLTAESEANLRRAHTEARWELRHSRREFGDYASRYITDDLRMAGWLAERIRVEAPDLSAERLATMPGAPQAGPGRTDRNLSGCDVFCD